MNHGGANKISPKTLRLLAIFADSRVGVTLARAQARRPGIDFKLEIRTSPQLLTCASLVEKSKKTSD